MKMVRWLMTMTWLDWSGPKNFNDEFVSFEFCKDLDLDFSVYRVLLRQSYQQLFINPKRSEIFWDGVPYQHSGPKEVALTHE